jgi:hypothetical protein
MSFLSSFSTALRTHSAPLNARLGAQVQTPTDTIDKLVERIQTSPSVDDRRTAVLGLKGCCREFKEVRKAGDVRSRGMNKGHERLTRSSLITLVPPLFVPPQQYYSTRRK